MRSQIDELVARLGRRCLEQELAIAVAESCTGGSLGAVLSQCPGASQWFIGGVIGYLGEVKRDFLNVDDSLMSEHGVVSERVALAMADGLSGLFPGVLALSTTGWLDNSPVADENCRAESAISPAIRSVFSQPVKEEGLEKGDIRAGSVWLGARLAPKAGATTAQPPSEIRQSRHILLECANKTRSALREEVCRDALEFAHQLLDDRAAEGVSPVPGAGG